MIQNFVHTYRQLGWATIRVNACSKQPIGKWQDRTDEPDQFRPGDNVGVRLGGPSGGLVDVDLDCQEAVHLAPHFLPPTATFGRASKPRSHWLYICSGITKTEKPARTAVELRSTGGQTVFPGSVHETGEEIVWYDTHNVANIGTGPLLECFGRLCAATIIAKAWPVVQQKKDAHHAILALAGALYGAGWSQEQAESLLLPAIELTGGADPTGHRTQAIQDTFDDHDRNRWGWPKVAEFVGPVECKALQRAIESVPSSPRTQAAVDEVGELTDLGNAIRFFADHGDDARHVKGLGWLQWDGMRWVPDFGPIPLAVRSALTLKRLGEEKQLPRLVKWALNSQSLAKLRSCVDLAAHLDTRTKVADLDQDPWKFNCANGVVNLRTGEMTLPDREAMITKQSPIEYDPSAECPRFVQFLNEIFRGDWEVIQYMLRYLGSCLTGDVSEQIFQLWYGTGANGKSTLVEILFHILGDYSQKMASDLLIHKRPRDSSAPSPDIARLRGVRFAAGVETSEGQRWNESLVKELTGGDKVVARHLHKEPIEFSPSWKMVLAVNHKPVVRGTDHGIWRRIHLVPFLAQFDGQQKDPTLLSKLKAEAPGILRLLVSGCVEWQRSGLNPPESVRAAVEEYRENQDVVGSFLKECCELGVPEVVKMRQLYKSYQQWCVDSGEYQHGKHAFNRMIRERERIGERKRDYSWTGIRIKTESFA